MKDAFRFSAPAKCQAMKRTIALFTALYLAFTALAQTEYRLTPAATTLTWTGRKVIGQHTGHIKAESGSVQWGRDGMTGAEITIDMTSITVLDMDPESTAELTSHLKSRDFFNVWQYPRSSFRATRVEKIAGAAAGSPNYTVTGDLSIKGISNPVSFPVLAIQDKQGIRATGTLVFDRTQYGIKYRSGSVFDALGDKVIDDKVQIDFNLRAQ